MASIGAGSVLRPAQPLAIGPGTMISHFAIIEEIGQGGMGTVFAAHDTVLGRRVALKLVKVRRNGQDNDELAQRLLREAQAMAAISHPNVVTVHEVGTLGTEVFLAMELIDGGTLAQWMALARHPWTELARKFTAAGRGLEAAHQAGLVHRDFKPQNVLVTRGGRVCVSDFGLVQAGPSDALANASGDFSVEDWSATLTATGLVMGTLRYMAPEQLRGAATDARADQYAFCVALFEALYHQHPFGDGPMQWMAAAVDGLPPEVVPRHGVPRRIRRALRRGLAVDPQRRFASMTDLLEELEGALRRRRRIALASSGAAILGIAAIGGFAAGRPDSTACETSGRLSFGDAWREPARKSAVAQSISAGALGEETWPRVEARLDAYVERGEALRTKVCGTIDTQTGSERVLAERTLECLAMHDVVLDVVVELLGGGEEIGAADPLDVIYSLEPLDSCEEVSARASVVVPPPAKDETAVRSMRRRIAAATAIGWGGRPEPAIASLEALLAEAEQLGYAPLVAQAHHALGTAEQTTDVAAALEHLRTAYALALRAGDDVDVVNTLTTLAAITAERSESLERAEWMIAEVEHWLARLGLAEGPELNLVRSNIARARADMPAAIDFSTRAVEIAEAGESSPGVLSMTHANLGAVYAEQRDLVRAGEHLTRAVEIAEAAYGPQHRRTLRTRTNLVGLEVRRGRYVEADAMGREVLAAYDASGITDLPEVAVTLTILGLAARMQGYFETALPYDRRALAIRTRVLGENHPLVAESLEKIALDEVGRGHPDAAVPQMRRVLAMRRANHPAGHPAIGFAQIELSKVLRAAGSHAEAAAEANAGIVLLEASFASDEPRFYAPLLYAGMAALGAKDFDRALEDLDRAAALGDAAALTPFDWAELEFARAQALARGNPALPAARELAGQARARIEATDPVRASLIEEIERWLAPSPSAAPPQSAGAAPSSQTVTLR